MAVNTFLVVVIVVIVFIVVVIVFVVVVCVCFVLHGLRRLIFATPQE